MSPFGIGKGNEAAGKGGEGAGTPDRVKSHSNFAAKYQLPFLLLSDPELTAIQAYDVWKEKKLYGKVSMGVVRSTYLIDENGIIEKGNGKGKARYECCRYSGLFGRAENDHNFLVVITTTA